MLESLITSKPHIKLLLNLYFKSNTSAHFLGLESEFREPADAIRPEQNRNVQTGMLTACNKGNRTIYPDNKDRLRCNCICQPARSRKHLDQPEEWGIEKSGEVEKTRLTGAFARGKESPDLAIRMADGKTEPGVRNRLVKKVASLVKKEVTYRFMANGQLKQFANALDDKDMLLPWQENN